MNIILNEYEWADRMLTEKRMDSGMYKTLLLVAKKYYVDGYNSTQVTKLLTQFMVECGKNPNIQREYAIMESAVKRAKKYPCIRLDGIPITKPELDTIDSIEQPTLRRVALAMLCDAKYWDYAKGIDAHWTVSSDRDIVKMANVSARFASQCSMYAELRDLGLIEFAKKVDNVNVRVLFMQPGETAFTVTDFRNIGYQYLQRFGGSYYVCENCGVLNKNLNANKKGRPRKYCPECATFLHSNWREILKNPDKFGEFKTLA